MEELVRQLLMQSAQQPIRRLGDGEMGDITPSRQLGGAVQAGSTPLERRQRVEGLGGTDDWRAEDFEGMSDADRKDARGLRVARGNPPAGFVPIPQSELDHEKGYRTGPYAGKHKPGTPVEISTYDPTNYRHAMTNMTMPEAAALITSRLNQASAEASEALIDQLGTRNRRMAIPGYGI